MTFKGVLEVVNGLRGNTMAGGVGTGSNNNGLVGSLAVLLLIV